MVFFLYDWARSIRFKPPAARLIAVYTALVIAVNPGFLGEAPAAASL
jgi:hypothetical protein